MKKTKILFFVLTSFVLSSLFPFSLHAQEQTQSSSPPVARVGVSDEVLEQESEEQVPQDDGRISFDLKGIEITEFLRILSAKTGLTMVASREVTGRINVFLNDVSLDDALDIVLFSQNLALDKRNEVLYIMTAGEYKFLYGEDYFEQRKHKNIKLHFADPTSVFNVISQLKSDIGKIITDEASGSIVLIDTPEKLEFMEEVINQLDTALESRVYTINYAKVGDIQALLADVITPLAGKIIVDERSSKIIVSDLPEKMEKIEQAIRSFDEQDKQVFIEAEIVQITLGDKVERGIDWENVFSPRRDGIDLVGKFPVSPALSSPLGKLTVGTIPNDGYTAAIEFLKTFGDVKILSRPRIAAINNEEAKILVGKREAFVTSTSSQGESTTITSESIEYIDVGIKLNVTPTINHQGFVTMKIKPEVSEVTETLTTSAGSRVPIVSTSEAETVVRVKNGTTIMIAGLMKTERRDSLSGIPFLSDIPVIGAAFSTKTRDDKDTELIIFLTPHIITGASPMTGTSIADMIPKKLLADDMKKDIVRKELEKIQFSPKEKEKVSKKTGHKGKDSDFLKRLKGLKKY